MMSQELEGVVVSQPVGGPTGHVKSEGFAERVA